MSFSHNNGAKADVAAGCQKNLRTRWAAATLVSVSLCAFLCSRKDKCVIFVIFLKKTNIKYRNNDLTLLLAANPNTPDVDFMRDL